MTVSPRAVDLLQVGAEPRPLLGELVLGDRLQAQREPLGDRVQVGAGVQAGGQAVRAQQAGHRAGRGGLAVGAGDVDGRVRPLGMIQQLGERRDARRGPAPSARAGGPRASATASAKRIATRPRRAGRAGRGSPRPGGRGCAFAFSTACGLALLTKSGLASFTRPRGSAWPRSRRGAAPGPRADGLARARLGFDGSWRSPVTRNGALVRDVELESRQPLRTLRRDGLVMSRSLRFGARRVHRRSRLGSEAASSPARGHDVLEEVHARLELGVDVARLRPPASLRP